MYRASSAHSKHANFTVRLTPSSNLMSIKVTTEVWQGSRHKSGNLLVLLALADHADDQGKAWPGVALLARKARLSQRHTRRCLNELVASGELEILSAPAPSGGKWYQIQLDQLTTDNLSSRTSTSDGLTPVSGTMDAADRTASPPYIEEPSVKSSKQPNSKMKVTHSNSQNRCDKKKLRSPTPIGLVSSPNNGF
jgi:hypothetical protein